MHTHNHIASIASCRTLRVPVKQWLEYANGGYWRVVGPSLGSIRFPPPFLPLLMSQLSFSGFKPHAFVSWNDRFAISTVMRLVLATMWTMLSTRTTGMRRAMLVDKMENFLFKQLSFCPTMGAARTWERGRGLKSCDDAFY